MPTATSAIPVLTAVSLTASQVAPVLFFLVFFVWVIYTVVAAYHWVRYSSNTTFGISAIIVHVIVSSWLAIYAVSGLVH